MFIGELSRRSGFSRDTIRYYEKIGLIEMPEELRTENNYKDYPNSILQLLKVIRKYKDLGLTLEEIRELIVLQSIKVLNISKLTEVIELKIAGTDKEIEQLHERKMKLTRELHALTGKRHGHVVDLTEMKLAA